MCDALRRCPPRFVCCCSTMFGIHVHGVLGFDLTLCSSVRSCFCLPCNRSLIRGLASVCFRRAWLRSHFVSSVLSCLCSPYNRHSVADWPAPVFLVLWCIFGVLGFDLTLFRLYGRVSAYRTIATQPRIGQRQFFLCCVQGPRFAPVWH